jgi:hypothetical protein
MLFESPGRCIDETAPSLLKQNGPNKHPEMSPGIKTMLLDER